MPKYANNQEYRPREVSGTQAAVSNFQQNLPALLGKYQEREDEEKYTAIVTDPKASPIQQALAWTKLKNPQAAAQVIQNQNIAQKGKLANDLMADTEKRIAENRGQTGNVPSINDLQQEFGGAQQPASQMMLPGQNQQQQPQQRNPIEVRRNEADILDDTASQMVGIDDKKATDLRHKANQIRKDVNADIQSNARIESAEIKTAQRNKEQERKQFESDRSYNESKSSDFQKTVSGLRQSIPRKENAQILARQAVESGDLGAFSKDNLANILGRPELRTASGATLNLAIKENLLSNLSRVTARGTNKWLEQVMIGAFPQTGQSLEANLTAQEAIEAELALDKAEVEIFDRLSKEDIQKQGYIGGDIEQRVFQEIQPIENEIRDRTSYRTRILYEQQKDKGQLKDLANKKPPTGTPLTPKMFHVFFDNAMRTEKDPDIAKIKATERAKQLGYVIYSPLRIKEFMQ